HCYTLSLHDALPISANSYADGTALWYWGLLALPMPHMLREWREQRYQWGSVLMGWVLALCLCVGTGFAFEGTMRGAWIGTYTGRSEEHTSELQSLRH